MRRLIFFALAFPPGVMYLLLIQTRPTRVAFYFIAGYIIEIVPALLIALTDEVAERKSPLVRAGWCALAGFVLTPIPVWLLDAYRGAAPSLRQCLEIGCAGALVAFLCAIAIYQLQPRRAR
jgi:hypothetical protein